MHYFSTILFLVFSASLASQINAEPVVIPTSPAHRGLAKYGLVRERQIQELQTGMNYCFGIDSICTYANNLYSDCQSVMDSSDLTQWYECICGNGYISTNTECYWCEIAFNLTSQNPAYSSAMAGDSAGCSSVHATIAPVPSSVIASASAWNVTFAGFLATASTFGLPTQFTTGPVSSVSSGYVSTITQVGGALPTSTTSGGPESTATTTTKAGSNTGGAEGWRTMSGAAVIFSILSFGVSVLYVL